MWRTAPIQPPVERGWNGTQRGALSPARVVGLSAGRCAAVVMTRRERGSGGWGRAAGPRRARARPALASAPRAGERGRENAQLLRPRLRRPSWYDGAPRGREELWFVHRSGSGGFWLVARRAAGTSMFEGTEVPADPRVGIALISPRPGRGCPGRGRSPCHPRGARGPSRCRRHDPGRARTRGRRSADSDVRSAPP